MSDFKARLVRFFEHYNKEKLATVDKILESYAGKEDALFDALTKKYGPEPAAGGGADADHKARLIRFFEKYNKEKLPTVDKVLEAYKGKEDKLFEALVGKYGPEDGPAPVASPAKAAPAPATGGGQTDYRGRLVRFFEKYNKEKLATVDKILESYKGKEEKLFETLVAKYGPEEGAPASSAPPAAAPSTAASDPRARLVRFFEKYNKEKLPTVDKVLEAYKGKEDKLFEALVGKYGPEPAAAAAAAAPVAAASSAPAAAMDPRSRLVRFFEHYNKEKLPTVDKVLEAYKGKEDKLFEALVGKYGPEPAAPGGAPAAASAPAPAAAAAMDPRSRLVRFFEKYNKEKLSTVDKVLEAYKGKEDKLFEALVGKYGPEPAAAAAAAPSASAPAAMDPRSRLVRFFEKYNKEKLATVDKILESYQGKEEKLFEALVGKYGPEPAVAAAPVAAAAAPVAPAAMDPRSRLVRFFEHYNKEKLPTVDKVLEAYKGKEDKLFEALVGKYGPEPTAPGGAPAAAAVAMDPRSRLVRFFEKYNKEKLSTVDKVLEAYKGKEDKLFEALVGKYGPEPAVAASAPAGPGPGAAPAAAPVAMDPRSRLVRFFEHYNKEKLGTVDRVLDAYKGKEEKLFDALVGKYGPEPATAPPAQEEAEEEEDDDEEDQKPDEPTKEEILTRICDHYKKTPKEVLTDLLGGPAKTTEFLKRNYVEQDFEARLRGYYYEHAPEKVAMLSVDLATVTTPEAQQELFKTLTKEYGPEPLSMEPQKTVNLMTRKARKIEDEELSEPDEEQKVEAEFEMPDELVESERIIAEADAAPPGEYSGDEAKCYPAEEEYWVRIQFETMQASERDLSSTVRSRAYTEFVRGDDASVHSGDDGSVAGGRTSPRGSQAEDSDEGDDQTVQTQLCRISDRRGLPSGSLCITCSALVSRAFGALWTPVGPRHRKLMDSMQTKNGFLEKLSGGRIGNKWQRRWMKINDFGIHYFETDKAGEKPKGHKTFTKVSKLIEDPTPDQFPKCNDPRFFHFVIFVNNSQEPFALRAATKQDKDDWISFLKEGLERLKVTMVGQDPNPARWRARVEGMKESAQQLLTAEKEDAKLVNTLKTRREFLLQQLEEERAEVDFLKCKVSDFADQNTMLSNQIIDLRQTISDEEAVVEVRTAKAKEEVIRIDQEKSMLNVELQKAAENAAKLEKEVQSLKCRVIDAHVAKTQAEQKCKKLYNKWTNVSEKVTENKSALKRV